MSARRVPTISPALLRARDDETETDVAQSMGTLAVAVQLMDLPLELLVPLLMSGRRDLLVLLF